MDRLDTAAIESDGTVKLFRGHPLLAGRNQCSTCPHPPGRRCWPR
jgi:hypothetical protein